MSDRIRIGKPSNNLTIRSTKRGSDVSVTVFGYMLGKGPDGLYTGVQRPGVSARKDLKMPKLSNLFKGMLPKRVELPAALSDTDARAKVMAALMSYIGNEGTISRMSTGCIESLVTGTFKLRKNWLLTGPPGCGKSELMSRIGKCLSIPVVYLDGKAVKNREQLFSLIDEAVGLVWEGKHDGRRVYETPPVLVAIDEVHLVGKQIQESLLTATDPNLLRVTLDRGIVSTRHISWIFGTTVPSKLDRALYDRCEECHIGDYNPEEIRAIMESKGHHGLSPETYHKIGELGKRSPRYCLSLCDDLRMYTSINKLTEEEALIRVKEDRGFDENDLDSLDRRYLEALSVHARAVGMDTIQATMGTVDPARVFLYIEPWLVKRGYVTLTTAGRKITKKGMEIVKNIGGERSCQKQLSQEFLTSNEQSQSTEELGIAES